MTTGPTPAQVAAQVAMIRRHRPEARVIGIHTPGGWLGGATLQVNGETCSVAYCSSALQVREALVSLDEGRMPQDMGKAPHPNPLPGGRAALHEAALRRRSRGERASPCADAVAPEGTETVAEPLLVVITPLDEAQLGL